MEKGGERASILQTEKNYKFNNKTTNSLCPKGVNNPNKTRLEKAGISSQHFNLDKSKRKTTS